MKETKYIVYEDDDTGIEEMLIFSMTLQHYDVAKQFGVFGNIRSGGFVRIGIDHKGMIAEAYGESISLGVKSREDKDTLILHRVLGFLS